MQKNKEIGKIQRDVPVLVGRAVHHFLKDLSRQCSDISVQSGKTGHCMNFKLTKDHVKEAIFKNPKFAFLRKIVEDIEPEQPTVRNTSTYIQKVETTGQEIPV